MGKHETLGIYDYDREKICDLYDSRTELIGQAYNIKVTKDINGQNTLEFSLPYVKDAKEASDEELSAIFGLAVYGLSRYGRIVNTMHNQNYRWAFMKSDFLIRYTCDEESMWFVASKPKKSKTNKSIEGNTTCNGFESLLKTRNIYMSFDDENGIGTIDYLMAQILKGTGWTYLDKTHGSDTIMERDGETEKVRSLNSDGKRGALDLITTTCNLFQARPVFDTDAMTVKIKAMKNREQVLEGEIGKNLSALSVGFDSSNIATRVYVEGEYGDYGYVGIDDVEVDENGRPVSSGGTPYGLSYIMNFDYYREIGVFKARHEAALATYITQIKAKKQEISANGALLIAAEDSLNELIGQCKLAVYYVDDLTTPEYLYGDVTEEQAELHINDRVVILKNNGTYLYDDWTGSPAQVADAYGVAKFVTASAGKIGAGEVQIEAKEKSKDQLYRKINVTVNPDKIAEYEAEILRLNLEIAKIYEGDNETETDGLYALMHSVMADDGYLYQYSHYKAINDQLNIEQDNIEATFISAMGYMLRDGYWNDNNYTVGQEVYLYEDALDITKEMSKPSVSYSFSYVRVAEDFDIPADEIAINAIFKIHDEELEIDDKMFVKKITYGVDDKSLGTIDVSNQDITLTGNDLGSLMSRMSQLADLIEQKNALYERAKAISNNGSIFADRLNGSIDVLKNKILSSVSNWYTDDQGNIVFEDADGGSAVMLSGSGIMLADGRDTDGNWNWRTSMDGHGINADEIVAGFISAGRIESGSITADKLDANVGSSLDLSSNVALNAYINNTAEQKAAEMQLTDQQFTVQFNRTVADGINNSISDVQGNLENYQTEVSNYMRYDNTGTLTLGKANNAFTTQIDNTKMSFKQNNTEVAYISNQSMFITTARVTEQLSLGTNNGYGYFDWVVTPTGLGLKWRNS